MGNSKSSNKPGPDSRGTIGSTQPVGTTSQSATPQQIRIAIADYLNKRSLVFTEIPQKAIWKLRIKNSSGYTYTTIIHPDSERDILLIYHVMDEYKVPDLNAQGEQMKRVIEYIVRANWEILCGNFELDFNDGEVRFKICTPIAQCSVEALENAIETMMSRSISVLDKHMARIIQLTTAKFPTSPQNSGGIASGGAPKNLGNGGDSGSGLPATGGGLPATGNSPASPAEPKEKPKVQTSEVQQALNNSKLTSEVERADMMIPYQQLQKVKKIGKGGFAKVYLANWNGTKVALKELNTTLGQDVVSSFQFEFKTMMSLHHPNVLLLMGVCTGPLCIVTEFMEKGSLHDILHGHSSADYSNFTIAKKLEMAAQIARGLAYIHYRKIIHGDLKPMNVLVDNNFTLKIADFGLARFKQVMSSMQATASGNTVLPATGFTPVYASPELLRDSEMSEKSDSYAYAIVLWEMLFQKTPFFGSFVNFNQLIMAIQNGTRPQVPGSHPYPPALVELMKRCWTDRAADRPRMQGILDDLGKVQETVQ